MKLSILTATYNRGELLKKLYESIKQNIFEKLEVEWLIMDDGSTDNTKNTVKEFQEENVSGLEIKYFVQENQGKMKAINNLMEYVTGELVTECDSDDYFSKDAFKNIFNSYSGVKDEKDLYALVFLKFDKNNINIGKNFEVNNYQTKMFDLYFKDSEDGEKALVYISAIRKNYMYELQNNEKFITEASLHHKLDEKYNVKCFNIPIMICEYQKEGYTKNIIEIFRKYPYGYFKYFEDILKKDFTGVIFKKRLYAVKHYILFSCLTDKKIRLVNIKNLSNKLFVMVLYLPGRMLSFLKFKNK